MSEMREKLRAAYEKMTAGKDTLPTAQELAHATGASAKYVRSVLAQMGLPYRHVPRFGTLRPKGEERKPTQNPAFELYVRSKMSKVLELKMSGDPAARPEVLPRAGAEYKVTDRIMITCPVCGAQKLIAPRMHPFWLRNRAGEVIFVCGAPCTGKFDWNY